MTDRFACAVVRHRKAIFVAWALGLLALVPAARLVERRLDVSAHVEGSEGIAGTAAEARVPIADPKWHYTPRTGRCIPRIWSRGWC